MENQKLTDYIEEITKAFQGNALIKISISKKRSKSQENSGVSIKPVSVKSEILLSFVYRYPTQDLTKNFKLLEAVSQLRELLENDFLQSELYTTSGTVHYLSNKKGNSTLKIKSSGDVRNQVVNTAHDKAKKRYVSAAEKYFHLLGISNQEGVVRKDGQSKFKQINKFIETIKALNIKPEDHQEFCIYDMGSGKGYLSFALYDYLSSQRLLNCRMIGIELRKSLVEQCNAITKECGYNQLHFMEGMIEDTKVETCDMLIALHACDIATDAAIAKGIVAGAKYIICSPCCHKQLRPQIDPDNVLQQISRYGILKERQAEMLTDTIRAMIMEAYGYRTKIMEYISTEHTPKNIMLIGIRTNESLSPDPEVLEKIEALKSLYGVKEHYLETLLDSR